MPELRQNLATKEWVVISTERAQKPGELGTRRTARASHPEKDSECPFCPGNEGMSEPLATLGGPGDWKVRVVRNKFPALVPNAPKVASRGKLFRVLPGEGTHEVVVESPSHRTSLADQPVSQVALVLEAYKRRFATAAENLEVALTILFKNHGAGSGASMIHPHSQLIGSCVVPAAVRHRMDEAQKFFDQNNECVFCRMNEEELEQKERVVARSRHFTAYVLFAALSPFHVWIVPNRHMAAFHEITDAERDDLAVVLRTLLKKVQKGLDDPDYNFVVQSVPQDRGASGAFHWYLSLIVRSGQASGFELGSGMHINTVRPEEAAKFLNDVPA